MTSDRDKMTKSATKPAMNILGTFEGRTHLYPVHIFYEDTDFSGVVYHANYLSFLEHDMAFTIKGIAIEYKSPARVDDDLLIYTTYDKLKGARLLITQSCYRGDTLIVKADIEAACITASGRPVRSPDFLKAGLKPYLLD